MLNANSNVKLLFIQVGKQVSGKHSGIILTSFD